MTLRKAAFSASRWTATSLLVRALLQVAQTMILARLLAPSDFGLMGVAGSIYTIATLFVDMGLSNALIHFPEPPRPVLSTLYWANLVAALVVMSIFAALAWPFAHIFRQPQLLPLMVVMALSIPLGAAGQQFRVMAEKELRFTTLAMIEVASSSIGFVVALIVALLGGGVYSLVAALLASSSVSSALAWILLSDGLRPGLHFDLRETKPFLRYGSYRLGDTLCNTLQSQADVLIGGSAVGAAAMGIYTTPRDLTLKLANVVINPIVTRVSLPVMAKVQHDIGALKSVYLQTLRMTSSVNFPIYASLAVWAPEAVTILLGPSWHAAVLYMRLFAVWGLIRSTGNPVGSLLYATGHVRRAFWWNFAQLLVVPLLLWLGASIGGTNGLAITMLCLQLPIFLLIYLLMVKPACGARFREYLGSLTPALFTSVLAVLLGFFASRLFPDSLWLRVVASGAVTASVYLASSFTVNRPWLDAMWELFHPVLARLK